MVERIGDHVPLGTGVQTLVNGEPKTGRVIGVDWSERDRRHRHLIQLDVPTERLAVVSKEASELLEITEEFRDNYVERDPEVLAFCEKSKSDG